jgi:hypothetical protein
MNAVGSGTGRVMAGTSDTSRDAAIRVGAGTQREIAYRALAEAGEVGLTSIEVAERLPLTHQGYPQNSNRSASRLGELWEEGRVAVKRQIGVCVLGVCHHHDKPAVVHRPMAPCVIHGKPMTRGGAARWIAL